MSEDILSSLQQEQGSDKCHNCGATNWDVARTKLCSEEPLISAVVMCNKCPGCPEDWDPVKNDQ